MAREPRERGDRERDSEFIDKLVHINRVAKVVKGGRRFGFAALVVVGDQRGRVGFGHGKAREVPEAIRKATDAAKRNMVRIPLKDGRTLHHETTGHHGAGKVIVRPADQGTGIIAGGPMRAVFESLGVGDVVVQRAAGAQRHEDQLALGALGRLADRLRHLARLAVAEADPALLIADDDKRGEAETPAALHHLGDAVDVDELVDELAVALFAVAVASAVPAVLCHDPVLVLFRIARG